MSTSGKKKHKHKKAPKVTASLIKTKNPKKKQNPWSAFWATSITTVVVFWVLFPFYSFQLQLILDQRQCKGQSQNDQGAGGGGKCLLPHNLHQPPYYPCKDGVLPPNAIESKTCPVEHVQGPDWFTYMLHLSRSFSRDIYSIIVGETWITADSELQKVEEKLKKKQNTSTGVASASDATPSAPVAPLDGGRRGGTRENRKRKKIGRDPSLLRRALQSKKPRFFQMKTIEYKDKNFNEYAMDVMEKSLGFSDSSFRKNKIRSLCSEKFKEYSLEDEIIDNCTDDKPGLFDYPPFNWILPKKYGWPYNYIYDDPAVQEPTAYDPGSDGSASSPGRWVGAWFAKTQQRSWSTSRGIWSDVLSYFLPYLHEELPVKVVEDRLTDFIEKLEEEDPFNTFFDDAPKEKKENAKKEKPKLITAFKDIRTAFEKKFGEEDRKKYNGKKTLGARDILFNVMQKYFKEGKRIRENDKKKENIYLDFYIAATKPESLRNKDGPLGNGFAVFWNFFEGDYRYWFRYLTTLYMPVLSMVVMMLAAGTGLILTPFASLNRYSIFVLPLFFGLLTTFYNMAAMPTEVFFYMLFGAMGKRNDSSKTPYDGGNYQMQRNVRAYWPINLFITLAIIVSSLGTTLTKTGKSWGIAITLIFPGLIVLRLLTKIGYWLWTIS